MRQLQKFNGEWEHIELNELYFTEIWRLILVAKDTEHFDFFFLFKDISISLAELETCLNASSRVSARLRAQMARMVVFLYGNWKKWADYSTSYGTRTNGSHSTEKISLIIKNPSLENLMRTKKKKKK